MVGGLFTSVSAIATILVGFFNRGKFTSYVIQNLFLARNMIHLVNDSSANIKNEDLKDEKVVAAHSQEHFSLLKENTKKGRVKEQDIDNIVSELKNYRMPLRTLRKSSRFSCIQLLEPFCNLCSKYMSKRTSYEFNRTKESERKFLKVCDIQYII